MATIPEALATAIQLHQAGRLEAAGRIYGQILQVDPNQADAIHLLGVIAHQMGNHGVAVEYIERAIVLRQNSAIFHNNLGEACRALGKIPDALSCYRRAVELKPDYADAHFNLGVAFQAQGNLDEASASYRQTVELEPYNPKAHINLGVVFQDQGKLDEALASYRRALELQPGDAMGHNNLGVVFRLQGKLDDALACYRRALELKADFPAAHNNLGVLFQDQEKPDEALACYRRALELEPNYAEAHNNLGVVCQDQGKLDEALAGFRQAVKLKPDNASSLGPLVHTLQHLCCWEDLQALSQHLTEVADTDGKDGSALPVPPFISLSLPTMTTAEQQLRWARRWTDKMLRPAEGIDNGIGLVRPRRPRSKIRLGYLSANFQSHAIAYLIAELIEKHDRRRFDVFGYSYGPDDGGPMRRRLSKAFDSFVDAKDITFVETAHRITADKVDILIDLTGHTRAARTQILALRPAPIQVNYLGYPGTMGADFVDYILVDEFVVPPEQQPYFAEKLVYLPGCYQVNDSKREISQRMPSRAECGLPEDGFVFCCFNNSYKITPAVFGVWMDLLNAIPGAVLWLLEGNRSVPANLRKEAKDRGVAPERLVFAPHKPLAEHLARHRLVDLFLDTVPYNAHTTASDALWAGCPVLTIAGETFASRVGGSLVRAAGLPELITSTLPEYYSLALRLASDPAGLRNLRSRLAANRKTSPLFDARRFARNLEKAYATMWKTYSSPESVR